MSLLQALLRLLTLSRPPAKPWEVTACNRPFLAIHFDSGMSVLPSWTTSQGDWSLVLEFGGVIGRAAVSFPSRCSHRPGRVLQLCSCWVTFARSQASDVCHVHLRSCIVPRSILRMF